MDTNIAAKTYSKPVLEIIFDYNDTTSNCSCSGEEEMILKNINQN